MTSTEEALKNYFARGGKITGCKPGTPKDLKGIIRTGYMFGGARAFKNAVALRTINHGRDAKIMAKCKS